MTTYLTRVLPLAASTSHVHTVHRCFVIDASFERFTGALHEVLGHVPSGVEQDFVARPKLAAQRIKAAEGAQNLMIFSVFDHGAALNMVGGAKKAKQYLIGNPLTAISMTQHDIRAALYAPLRVLVYEQAPGRTIVEYDQPSSQFGQFERVEVSQVGWRLDEELERLLIRAAELSNARIPDPPAIAAV